MAEVEQPDDRPSTERLSAERTSGERLPEMEVESAIAYLNKIQRQQRISGLETVIVSLVHLALVLATAFRFGGFARFDPTLSATGSIFITLLVLGLVVQHERRRKTGDALFEVISDEFQFGLQKKMRRPSGSKRRPYLDARIVLREYSGAADLPLVPGKFGPGIYALLNIAFLVAEFILNKAVQGVLK
jgi:hypothetical protein